MGKSNSAITGYRYKLSVVMLLQEGAVDEIFEFRYGERTVFKYDPGAPPYVPDGRWGTPFVGPDGGDQINQNARIIDDTEITIRGFQVMGGDEREGGAWGDVGIHMGKSAVPDSYLAARFGPDTPAYVACTSLVFKDFIWSANNPYFKPLAVHTRCLRQNWRNDVVWYPEKLAVGQFDMNPAHIIYQLITSPRYNMAWPTADINDANFRLAADQFHAEGFGLSGIYDMDASVEEFIQIIASTVNCELRLGETSGLYEIVMIRDNYAVDSLTEVGPDNIVVMSSLERAGYGELGNTLTVMYTDREQVQQPYTMNDQAAITKQSGQIIPVTREYLLIREPSLAARVCARDLTLISGTLAKAVITTDRILHKHQKGDVIAFTWPRLGIVKAPFRIISINKKDITDGTIDIEIVEDVFGLPSNSYTGLENSQWTEPSGPPEPALYERGDEVPYRDIRRYLPQEQFDALTPDYCFGRVAAIHGPGSYFNFKLANSETVGGYYEEKSTGHFCPSGVLVNALTRGSLTMQIQNGIDISGITVNQYAIIEQEAVIIEAIDRVTNVISIGRGTIDTVPAPHAAGTRVWFLETRNAVDPTQRLPGTATYYKVLPMTGYGSLRAGDATPINVTFAGRAQRPYPPGKLRFNSVANPAYITSQLTVSWAHRNRITQADQLIPTTTDGITPELNTEYVLTVKGENGLTLFSTNTPLDSYQIEPEQEYTPGVVNYGTDTIIVAKGLAAVESPLSINIVGDNTNSFGKVDGGWMRPIIYKTQVNGRFVNETTGAITNRTDNTLVSLLTNTVMSVKPEVAQLDKSQEDYYIKNPGEAAAAGFTPYNGWAVYKNYTRNLNVAVDEIPQGTPILDRRVNPTHTFVRAVGIGGIEYSARTVTQAKAISTYQLAVYRMTKASVVTGPLGITRNLVTSYIYGSPNQFDSLDSLPDTSVTNTIFTYGSTEYPGNLGIIFDELMYLPGLGGFNTVSSAGKPLAITNILSADINLAGSRRDETFVMKVDSAGVVTQVASRVGIVLADKLDANVGFEVGVTSRQVSLVNSTTGVISGGLGSVGVSGDCVVAVYGDYVNHHIYILLMKPNTSLTFIKYSATLTLLSQINLPVGSGILARFAAAVSSSMIRESQGYFYVRCNTITFEIAKDFSTLRTLASSGTGSYLLYPGYSNPSSNIVNILGKSTLVPGSDRALFDETGMLPPAYFSNDTPRIQAKMTIELGSTRDGLASTQKHVQEINRYGYGLHYGVYYGD